MTSGHSGRATSHDQGGKTQRDAVRATAGKVIRSDDLVGDEKNVAAGILRANPVFGNPHVIRCDWCHETRTLFRDEDDGPFVVAENGWRCVPCGMRAASQEVKF
jgi:hypothetical protein